MFRAAVEQTTEVGAGEACEFDPATGERKC
jgi:hypothetical protein